MIKSSLIECQPVVITLKTNNNRSHTLILFKFIKSSKNHSTKSLNYPFIDFAKYIYIKKNTNYYMRVSQRYAPYTWV